MSTCKTIDIDELGVYVLDKYASIVSIYVFGSGKNGNIQPGSDLDIGIFIQPGIKAADPLLNLRISSDLEEKYRVPVDVVILNQVSPILIHEVLLHGVRIAERDSRLRAQLEINGFKDYIDSLHMQKKRNNWKEHQQW